MKGNRLINKVTVCAAFPLLFMYSITCDNGMNQQFSVLDESMLFQRWRHTDLFSSRYNTTVPF
jgi:hypothetical protein